MFKPLVFGFFGKMSSNVVSLVETAVEYGVEHLEGNMAVTTVVTVRVVLHKRYNTQLSMATWRGYANLLLDKTKYVGTIHSASNRAQFR